MVKHTEISKKEKSILFYGELITAAIFGIVAGNIWLMVIKGGLQTYFPNNLLATLVVALCLTLFFIWFLYIIFKEKYIKIEKYEERM